MEVEVPVKVEAWVETRVEVEVEPIEEKGRGKTVESQNTKNRWVLEKRSPGDSSTRIAPLYWIHRNGYRWRISRSATWTLYIHRKRVAS